MGQQLRVAKTTARPVVGTPCMRVALPSCAAEIAVAEKHSGIATPRKRSDWQREGEKTRQTGNIRPRWPRLWRNTALLVAAPPLPNLAAPETAKTPASIGCDWASRRQDAH